MNVRPLSWGGPALGLLALTLAAAWLAQAHQTGSGLELGQGPQAGSRPHASGLAQAAVDSRTRVLGSSLSPSRLTGLDPSPALQSAQTLSALQAPAGLTGSSGELHAQHAGEARSGSPASALAAEPASRPPRPLDQMRPPREPLPPGAQARQAAQQAARQGSNQAAMQLADATSLSSTSSSTADTSQVSNNISTPGDSAGGSSGLNTPPATPVMSPADARLAEHLYWLHLAAQRGDAEAQYRFAHAVLNQPSPSPAALSQQGLPALASSQALQAQARRYLVAAMDQGVLEAYQDATRVARQGGLGLAPDPVQALAIPLALQRGLDLPQTRELLDQAWREATPAQQQEAQRRSVSDLGRWMH